MDKVRDKSVEKKVNDAVNFNMKSFYKKLQEKIKNFIEELKAEGYTSTYDSYEFDSLYEFIIKVNK